MTELLTDQNIKILELFLQFGVVPVIIGLWQVNNSVWKTRQAVDALTILIYKDFATKSELNQKVNKRS